jgi:hypothetical protein
MAVSFYAVKLSDHLAETPEGYLVCHDMVIARTGHQTYKGSELPQRGSDTPPEEVTAQDLGINPGDDVKVYRSPDEVFSVATIASFESKPITDSHPELLLNSETHGDYACGHIRNVRKGSEALADGNWPLLADGVVTDKNLVLKIKSGLRELSCGYTYNIVKNGSQILQVDIVGNHVAVVPNGRAGPLAAIQDSAPAVTVKMEITHMTRKETLKNLLAMGFKAFAATAEPKEIAVAMDCMSEDAEVKAEPAKDAEVTPANDARKRAHDALDKMLDGKEEEAKAAAAASDKDMDDLKGLFASKDAEPTDKKEDASTEDAENEQEESEEETDATDAAVQTEASPIIEPSNRQQPVVSAAVDAAFKEGQQMILKALKPFVAKSNDPRLKGAFDTATKLTREAVAKTKGSYSAVAKAAATVAKDAGVNDDPSAKANAAYAAIRKEMLSAGKR